MIGNENGSPYRIYIEMETVVLISVCHYKLTEFSCRNEIRNEFKGKILKLKNEFGQDNEFKEYSIQFNAPS